ncbi:hypothetical protein C8F04DRAFT_1213584 [Mycena alexandri]|uniref:Uncharacterized protein n=1 Tax=Mycena alexandri TaxID=1745969 RepID=A0AAD6WRI2_9AGAR|nr:hypothetical protein C8F04DRAFT_1213584 [Mycena alexandri]
MPEGGRCMLLLESHRGQRRSCESRRIGEWEISPLVAADVPQINRTPETYPTQYLTIGNIGKETRRQVSSHVTVLIGYLPIPKFDCFDKNTRSLAKYRLFHRSMTVIMESIIEAGKTGVPMVCADSMMRNVWPIFAAYVADYPEQCLIACCKENRCPICTVGPNQRGDHGEHPLRDMRETLYLMHRQQGGQKDSEFEDDGIRAVYPPFWTNLPHSDIFQSFTPDLLHQLHKGVFKDHLVSWCTEIIGKLEVDDRFRAMPDHHGVRHFKNGISAVSQWTGAEHKEMEKVFLGLVTAGAEPEMVKAVRGLIDFAASNRKDYIEQMTIWLQRQEAVARFTAYLSWVETLEVPKAALPRTTTTVEPIAPTTPSPAASQAPIDKDSLVISHHRLSLAKLPATRAVSATHIISKDGHNASRFIPALITFLGPSNSRFTPRTFDTFGTWKRGNDTLPTLFAPLPQHLRVLLSAGQQNLLIWIALSSALFSGLRVAQVKVIFQVPSHYPGKPGPLAYIEWFTPLRRPDDTDGYYHLSRSSRQHGPYAEIIPVDRIVRSAMLIPQKWGEDKSFLLNSHSDGHAFCLYKLGRADSLPT